MEPIYRYLVKECGLTYADIAKLTRAQILSLVRPDDTATEKGEWVDI